jgi:hypothetical protein
MTRGEREDVLRLAVARVDATAGVVVVDRVDVRGFERGVVAFRGRFILQCEVTVEETTR